MTKLARSIGLTQATAMVVGTIVGASIFVQPSEVSRAVPSFGGMLLVWTAAGALTWFGASICAELASAYPRTGGVYVFLREMFSPAVGFLWGWAMFWSMHTGIIAAIAMVFGRYAATIVPMGDTGVRLTAIGGVALLSAVNYFGVRPGSAVQTGLTIAKVAAIVGLLVLLLATGTLRVPAAAAPIDVGGFLRALVAGLFAFGGWHMVTYAAEETRDPERVIPRALMIGTAVVVVIYLALNGAYLLVLPFDRVLSSTHIAYDATIVTAGSAAASAISVLVIVSSFGGVSGIILAGPRVYLAMAEDRLLFRWMGAVHPQYRTPHRAIVVQAIWAAVLIWTGTYGVIVSRVVYTEWIFFGALALGTMRFRRMSGYRPAFAAAGFPIVPVAFAAVCLAIVVNQVVHDQATAFSGWRSSPREFPFISSGTSMVIDFHNHYYPPKYMRALQSGESSVRVTIDADGNPNIHYPGDYNIAVRGHRDLAYREEVLDQVGVAMQVLTLTTPGTHVETAATAVRLASLVNDEFKEAMETRGRHFTALATLPLNDPAASARELARAMDELGMRGAMLFSNVNGTALSDARFWPLYEVANERGAVLYIHPEHPIGVEAMLEYWLMPLCGFLFDTTLAAAKLVFSGVVERYPRIRWALCHLGGTIPYLAERLDRGFHAFRDCRTHIDREPSSYLKTFYYDTVNFNQGALKLAIEFAGADHILAGSDYPHQIGSIPSMLDAIARLPITEAERTAIYSGNAKRLLSIDR